MIISFSVSNFRSFLDEETLSLVASNRLSDHADHAVPIPGTEEKVLRTAVIYGANGAGKSNIFKALRFLRTAALEPREKNTGTGREVFRFGGSPEDPSCFDLQFTTGGKVYQFGLKVDDHRITEEWLIQVEGGHEKTIYERATDEQGKVTIESSGLKNAGVRLKALVTVGGPQNQSFLATVATTLEASDYGEELEQVIQWFDDDLVLIEPDATFDSLRQWLAENKDFNKFAGDFLRSSSTGVNHLEVIKTEITESELGNLVPEKLAKELLKRGLPDHQVAIGIHLGGIELLLEKDEKNDKERLYRVAIEAAHEDASGKIVPLNLSEESDGTRRLLNLSPALYHGTQIHGVHFIDEIDRSLHPILVREFLEFFLKSCSEQQLIVTTHESNLLDLDLLRRDEIWFAEKDEKGATHLYSLSDFKVRKDLEIRKHYLQGRFGAVPFLGALDRLLEEQNSSHEPCPPEI